MFMETSRRLSAIHSCVSWVVIWRQMQVEILLFLSMCFMVFTSFSLFRRPVGGED